MYNLIPSKFSIDKKLEIKFLDCEEINNGRMLWKVSVLYEDTNLDEFIFPKGWSYLNFELNNWTIQDTKNRFYYLPIESISILMDIKTLKIHFLPNQSLSTLHFKGNYFEDNFLIEKYENRIVKTNLKTLTSEEMKV
jgi:hypothetical protein